MVFLPERGLQHDNVNEFLQLGIEFSESSESGGAENRVSLFDEQNVSEAMQ